MFRGGGGGARASSRKRAENQLLDGLRILVEKFAPANTGPERPAKKPRTNHRSLPPEDDGLLQALQQLVLKAQQEPQGLLESLQALVQEFSQKAASPPDRKRVRWADLDDEPTMSQSQQPKSPPAGKGKGVGKSSDPTSNKGILKGVPGVSNKGLGKGSTKGNVHTPKLPATWAAVVANSSSAPKPSQPKPPSPKPPASAPSQKTWDATMQLH